MKIDSTEFGSITINGTTYSHDILFRLSGEIARTASWPIPGTGIGIPMLGLPHCFHRGCRYFRWGVCHRPPCGIACVKVFILPRRVPLPAPLRWIPYSWASSLTGSAKYYNCAQF